MTLGFIETTKERYRDIPVRVDDSEPRCVYLLDVPKPSLGDLWFVAFELHVTNDALRGRGYGIAAVTEIRLEATADNNRDGLSLLRANGSWNVGVEAHHALISRCKIVRWTEDLMPQWGTLRQCLKVYLMAKSTQALGSDRLLIDQGRGFLQIWPIGIGS